MLRSDRKRDDLEDRGGTLVSAWYSVSAHHLLEACVNYLFQALG